MYLLPVKTYVDYLRSCRNWTILTSGTVLIGFLLKSTAQQGSTPKHQKEIRIKLGDKTRTILSNQTDPYWLLTECRVAVGAKDVLRVDCNELSVLRVEEKVVLAESELPFKTENKTDYSLPPQTQRVSPGSPGMLRQIVKVTTLGDREISREVVVSDIIKEPVKRVIVANPRRATTPRQYIAVASRTLPANYRVKSELSVESTAYTYTGNNTATGVSPRVGLVAVDPRVIPLGSKLYIEGYGLAMAADTGGAIKGNRLDVFLNTVKECVAWGRRKVKVYILAGDW